MDDNSLRVTLAEMNAALDRSEAQADAGQVVPLSQVFAMLDRAVARAEQRQLKQPLSRQVT